MFHQALPVSHPTLYPFVDKRTTLQSGASELQWPLTYSIITVNPRDNQICVEQLCTRGTLLDHNAFLNL